MNLAPTTPLVVDLDGTLTPTDTLAESIVRLARTAPYKVLLLPLWLLRGRAAFKSAIADSVQLPVAQLPYRGAVLDFLRDEKKRGRKIVLATAANHSIATRVADHLQLFDEVLASDANTNLKGQEKLAAIKRCVGSEFVYAGDSSADLPIWKAATAAILVGVSERIAIAVRGIAQVEREFVCKKSGLDVWARAMRIHQWLKNLLLCVPLLTAFSFGDFANVATVAVAILAFSLAASATYIANDIWDLEHDRAHPRKQLRPFASGTLSIKNGVLVAFGLMAISLLAASMISLSFVAVLLTYIAITSSYSWILKRYVLVDVLTLSLLYTLRILAGSIVVGVKTSSWLLAFAAFLFFSLALVKRCSELVALSNEAIKATSGRDYRVTDLAVLWPLGVGAALSSVVVFGLFISTPDTQQRYQTPVLLWFAAVGLTYWLARLWIKTSRGEMHDDPLIYAVKDRGSRMAIIAMVVVTLLSHFVAIG